MQQTMDGKVIIQKHTGQNYITYFDQKSGFFVRKEDKNTEEPFWSKDGPELLDISITNYCENQCNFCYRHSNKKGKHMSMEDFQCIIEQAEDIGVLQIALGGGNPNQHPQFAEILKLVRKHNIVPSYTTNGDGLSHEILSATADYCGAMAVSYYPSKSFDFVKLLEKIKEYHIKTNVHLILNSSTIDFATKWLISPPDFFNNVNALIFLNYKPINKSLDLSIKDKSKIETFFRTASECKTIKIGFDSCCISGIAQWMNVYPFFMESCEAGRFSAFISEEMQMYPCSFMANTDSYEDLRKHNMIDIWRNSNVFTGFRNIIQNCHCKECKFERLCNGGCHFLPEINFCKC